MEGPRGKKIVSKMSFSSAKSMSVTHLHLAAKLVALEGIKGYDIIRLSMK